MNVLIELSKSLCRHRAEANNIKREYSNMSSLIVEDGWDKATITLEKYIGLLQLYIGYAEFENICLTLISHWMQVLPEAEINEYLEWSKSNENLD